VKLGSYCELDDASGCYAFALQYEKFHLADAYGGPRCSVLALVLVAKYLAGLCAFFLRFESAQIENAVVYDDCAWQKLDC
jgi:hypothetical protein